MSQVIIKESSVEVAAEVNRTITEFDPAYDKEYFENRYAGRKHLVLVGLVDNEPAGYIIAYDRDEDGSFYCWMAGVNPAYRRLGVLTSLMNYLTDWATRQHYKTLKIKTRNNRRAMLANLVKQGYLFTGVESHHDPTENRIELELPLSR